MRIFPGSANPVRVTTLPIRFPAGERVNGGPSTATIDGGPYPGIALSGDGTELAVVAVPKAGSQLVLQVYSVATGQLQHSWPTGVNVTSSGNINPITGLSWVGDSTLGFTLTKVPGASEEVRTLDVATASGNVLAERFAMESHRTNPPFTMTMGSREITILAHATRYYRRAQKKDPLRNTEKDLDRVTDSIATLARPARGNPGSRSASLRRIC